MFLENPSPGKGRQGWIEVVCGSMFSGKTEELIRRLRRAQLAGQRIAIVKPVADKRYDSEKVVSHDAKSMTSYPVASAADIMQKVEGAEVVGIDEAQFFGDDLSEVCRQLAAGGMRVVVAGLDMDYLGKPFGPMPSLMAMAEYVTKVHAICVRCGSLANHSHRKTAGKELVMLGEKDHYEALCRECFTVALAAQR